MPPVSLRIPQPCAESWDTMTPTALGRHCAACQKTVVDFSQKTDAEVLAYLAKATGETCGRFHNAQLNRPLAPDVASAAGSRWRTWLALLLAAWGTERAEAATRPTAHPTHRTPTKATPRRRTSTLAVKHVQGTVRDSVTGAPLVGVAVFLRGENRMASTDSLGRFRLRLSARRPRGGRALVLHYSAYQSATVPLRATARTTTLRLTLAAEQRTEVAVTGYAAQRHSEMTGGAVVEYVVRHRKPWPWHPRLFYAWSKYQVTRPFRRLVNP